MRVCMLSRNDAMHLPPSCWMAEALVARGHEVDYFTTRPCSDKPRAIGGVTYREIDFDWRAPAAPLKRVTRELRWATKFLSSAVSRYDLYWAHNIGAIPWIATAALTSRRPWAYQAHELSVWRESAGLNRAYVITERTLAGRAAFVVCPEPHRAQLMRVHNRLRQTPFVCRNAPPLRDIVASDRLRQLLPADARAGSRIILYQGGIGDAAQFEALIESVTRWPKHHHLVFVGWGDAGRIEALRRLASHLGVASRVHWHPPVRHDQVWPLVCSADVGLILYMNTTLNERYAAPNKLGEYLMAGLPVVYTSCDGLRTLLSDRPFASLVAESSAVGFAEALAVFDDDARLRAAARSARQFAETELNFEVQSHDVLAVVDALADRSS